MIKITNVETGQSIKIQYTGFLNQIIISKYINKYQKQLSFVGNLQDAQITHNQKGVFQFLTSTWSMDLISGQQLQIKIKSYEYLGQYQELLNKVNQLQQKAAAIDSNVQNFMRKTKEKSSIKANETLKIGLLWASPLTRQTNNKTVILKYESKYEGVFHSIIKKLQGCDKKIEVSTNEFNKTNFVAAMEQKLNILYIVAHAQFNYQTMEIYGESKDGTMEKFMFSQIDLEPDSIDLVILHSSYTEQFANKMEKVAKNLIVISSNVYSHDNSVLMFNEALFSSLIKGKTIKTSFEYARSQIGKTKNLLKMRCCCFHKHSIQCFKTKIIWLSEEDSFARYHKKCHLYSPCSCKDALRLIHQKSCTRFRQKIHSDYIPKQIVDEDKKQYSHYCCCAQMAQQEFRKTGKDLHSYEYKFELKKNIDKSFRIIEGTSNFEVESEYFIVKKNQNFSLVESRKQYISRCLKYIYRNTIQLSKHTLLINFFGKGVHKQQLSQFLFQTLVKKKLIEPKSVNMNQWKIEKASENIRNHSFIVIKDKIQDIDELMERCGSSKTKIILLNSNNRLFLPAEALIVQFKQLTAVEEQILAKRSVKTDALMYLPKLNSVKKSGVKEVPMTGDQMVEHQKFQKSKEIIGQEQLLKIKNNTVIYKLAVIFAYFNVISDQTISFIMQSLMQNQKIEEFPPFWQYKLQLFSIHENSLYKMKSDYCMVLKYYQKYSQIGIAYTTFEQLCFKFFYRVILQEIMRFPKYQEQDKKDCLLLDATTRNRLSILSLYLKQHKLYNEIVQTDIKPTLTFAQITNFIENLYKMKVKTQQHPDFQLALILYLNQKVLLKKYNENPKQEFAHLEKLQQIFKLGDPIFGSIFLQLTIQIGFDILPTTPTDVYFSGFKSRVKDKIQHCQKIFSSQFAEKIYKLIVDFDMLIGYMFFYSDGWEEINDASQQNDIKEAFRQYDKSRSQAFSKDNTYLLKQLEQIHGFKLNFIRMFVPNNRFQIMYKSLCQAPSKETKEKYQFLSIYLQLLNKRKRMQTLRLDKSLDKSLDILWQWNNELGISSKFPQNQFASSKYKQHPYEHIKRKLKAEIISKINSLTKNVCYILKSFALKNRPQQRSVLVEYNLVEKIKSQGFWVRQFPLTRINFYRVMSMRCRYLILWFQEELSYNKQIDCETQNPKDYFYLDGMIKEINLAESDLDMPIQHMIICSTNNLVFESFKKALSQTQKRPITHLIGFDFNNSQSKKTSVEENLHLNKLIMKVFTKNLIKETKLQNQKDHDQQNKVSLQTIVGRISAGIMKRFQLKDNFILLELKPRGAYEPIDVGDTSHTVYKGQMNLLIQIMKLMNLNDKKQMFMRVNLTGRPKQIAEFLNFFEKVCEIKMTLFEGGVFRIDCRQIQRDGDALPLVFIQKKLNFPLPMLNNSKSLLILQNFDSITNKCSRRNTYDYLFQLLVNDEDAISIIATSEGEITRQFKKTDLKTYRSPEKLLAYKKQTIKNIDCQNK